MEYEPFNRVINADSINDRLHAHWMLLGADGPHAKGSNQIFKELKN